MHKHAFIKIATLTLMLGAICLISPLTLAHHSFASTFLIGEKITIEGVVTKYSFKNPHVLIYINVTNDDGSVTEWLSEGASATSVRRRGLDADTFKAGDLVRVTGDKTRDGAPMTSIDKIDIVDPKGFVVRNAFRGDSDYAGGGPGARPGGPGGMGMGMGGRRPPGPIVKADPMPLTLSDGRPNLTGTWTIEGMGGGLPHRPDPDFSEAGAALQEGYDVTTDDPQLFCEPPGLMRQAGTTPHPIRITQLNDHVVIEDEEYGGRREIYFDDSHAKGIKTHLGDSVARYEGDKLVIETTNLLSNLVAHQGVRLSDQTTVVETYHRADTDINGPVLAIRVVATDPVNLNSELVMIRNKMSAGDYTFVESECTPPLRQSTAED